MITQKTTPLFEEGARNLLINCAGLSSGDRVLIVHEPAGLGFYDDDLAEGLAQVARSLGAETELCEVAFDPDADRLPDHINTRAERADQVIFAARLGDQLRFTTIGDGHTMVVSYALSKAMMSTAFASANYDGFVEIAALVDRTIAESRQIEVTCPAGTKFSGTASTSHNSEGEVSIRRFPKLIFTPVQADRFSGRVALCGFLVGTGSRYYDPYAVEFQGPIAALFKDGRLTGFEGSASDRAIAERHYDFVSEKFGIDRNCVHSWHAGLHPSCAYDGAAADNYERWSGSAFGNPRLLHLHTCGSTPPGEISLNIVDPTIIIDGLKVWERGVFHIDRLPGANDILARFPDCKAAFCSPSQVIGV